MNLLVLSNSEKTLIPVSSPNIPHRYLGIWISGSMDNIHTMNKVTMEVNRIQAITQKKKLTDKQAAYITTAVILPTIEYRTKGRYLTTCQTETLSGKIKKMIRTHANLSLSTGCKIINHPDFYNISTIDDIQKMARISGLIHNLNSPFIDGITSRIRLANYQRLHWTKLTPLANPTLSKGKKNFKFLNGIRNELAKIDCSIIDAENLMWKRSTPQIPYNETIEDRLGPFFNYSKATHTLRRNNILYVDQIINPLDRQIIPYSTLKVNNNLKPQGRIPEWHHRLRDAITRNWTYPTQTIQNKHHIKWKSTASKHPEILNMTDNEEEYLTGQSTHITIPPEHQEIWNLSKSILSNETHIDFYTDGSANYLGRKDNLGAAWLVENPHCSFFARAEGKFSSNTGEALAVLLALEASPPNCSVNIHTDSLNTVNNMEDILNGKYANTPHTKVIKKPNWHTWEAIMYNIQTKQLIVQTTKVTAHSGNDLNDRVDILAKDGSLYDRPIKTTNRPYSRIAFIFGTPQHHGSRKPSKVYKTHTPEYTPCQLDQPPHCK